MYGKSKSQKISGTSPAQKEANKRYKEKHRERILEMNKQYYNTNRDNLCEKARIKYYLLKE